MPGHNEVIGIRNGENSAEKTEEFAKADTFDLFVATAQAIRKDMESGGKFEFITQLDKVAANGDLDAMTALLKKSGSVSAMKMQDKVVKLIFNKIGHHVSKHLLTVSLLFL